MLLYDLINPPNELNDLGRDAAYQEKKKELFNELVKLQTQMDDPLNLKEIFTEI